MKPYLDGSGVIEADGNINATAETPLVEHPAQAFKRTIERWKDRTTFQAWLQSYAAEAQELELALWDVLIRRFPDYAYGVGLDMLGRVVGVNREGRDDDRFRVRVKVQIAINQSLGRTEDIIQILRLLGPEAFVLEEPGTAYFSITYLEPIPAYTAIELPSIIHAAKAAGVGAGLHMFAPTGTALLLDDEPAYASVGGDLDDEPAFTSVGDDFSDFARAEP